jgi:hypothetical protein
VRKIREQLLLELLPGTARNHGHFDDAQEVVEQARHLGIERGLAFGERAIKVVDDELLHCGTAASRRVTGPLGRKAQTPTAAGSRRTSPLPTA